MEFRSEQIILLFVDADVALAKFTSLRDGFT